MNRGKKLWVMDAQEFAEYTKTASKAELTEYKKQISEYIEYLQAKLRKYEAGQKALKDASHRLGLHLMEQLLKKSKRGNSSTKQCRQKRTMVQKYWQILLNRFIAIPYLANAS